MNIENPQKSPAPNAQEATRPRKLRLSCDSCSRTKVKCDQTRPRCLRCQKVGLDCNYSVSQRKGKPPTGPRTPSSSSNGHESIQNNQHSRAVSENLNPWHQNSHSMPIEPIFQGSTPDFWQNYMPTESNLNANDFFTPSSIIQVLDDDFLAVNTPSSIHSSQIMFNDDGLRAESDISEMLDFGFQHIPSQLESFLPTRPCPTPNTTDTERYDCTKLASSTLAGLNSNFPPCSNSAMQTSNFASFDRILIENEAAIDNVHQLFTCPCSLSQQSILMLPLIIDKILTLYQSIINADSSLGKLVPSSSLSDSSGAEQVINHPPITIGEYRMDAKDEQWMRVHILSKGLRKSAALVERYTEKYSNVEGQPGEEKAIYMPLADFLRIRLKKVEVDVASALSQLST